MPAHRKSRKSAVHRVKKYQAKIDPNVLYARFKFGNFTFRNNYAQKAILQEVYDETIISIINNTCVPKPFDARIMESAREIIAKVQNFTGATREMEFQILWRDFLHRMALNLTDIDLNYLSSLTLSDLYYILDAVHILCEPIVSLEQQLRNVTNARFLIEIIDVTCEYLVRFPDTFIFADILPDILLGIARKSEISTSFYTFSEIPISQAQKSEAVSSHYTAFDTYTLWVGISAHGNIQFYEDLISGKIPYQTKGASLELPLAIGTVSPLKLGSVIEIIDTAGYIPYQKSGFSPELLQTLGCVPKTTITSVDIMQSSYLPIGKANKPSILSDLETFIEGYLPSAKMSDVNLSSETYLEDYSTIVKKTDIDLVQDGLGLDAYSISIILYHPHLFNIYETVYPVFSIPLGNSKKSNVSSISTLDLPTSKAQKAQEGSIPEGIMDLPTSKAQKAQEGSIPEGVGLDTYVCSAEVLIPAGVYLFPSATNKYDVVLRYDLL